MSGRVFGRGVLVDGRSALALAAGHKVGRRPAQHELRRTDDAGAGTGRGGVVAQRLDAARRVDGHGGGGGGSGGEGGGAQTTEGGAQQRRLDARRTAAVDDGGRQRRRRQARRLGRRQELKALGQRHQVRAAVEDKPHPPRSLSHTPHTRSRYIADQLKRPQHRLCLYQ